MTNVPFFSNTPDDTHCFQASVRMVLKYFENDKEFTWEELDKITNKPMNMWTWPMAGLSWLVNNGYEVINIETFDYDRFLLEGTDYMKELWGEEVATEQVKHSDISMAQSDTRKFLDTVNIQNRTPTTEEIKDFVDDGYLVTCMVNSCKLNQENGFVGHSILIIGYADEDLIIHDPGSPALENRKILPHYLKVHGRILMIRPKI